VNLAVYAVDIVHCYRRRRHQPLITTTITTTIAMNWQLITHRHAQQN